MSTKYHKTIFIGDVSGYLGELAKQYDANAWLLTQSNMHLFNKNHDQDVTIYTSLGDLSKDLDVVYKLLCSADVIFYRPPPGDWSDNKYIDIMNPTSSLRGLTETLLMLLPESVQIDGLSPMTPDMYDPRPLVDQRKTQEKQLWVAGCSISHGTGVDHNERYGHLLSQSLGLECSFLTRPGSAIDWAADQILRSDIRTNDIVVWGITSWARFTYIHQHQLLKGVTTSTFRAYPEYLDIVDLDQLTSQQTFYHHYYCIQQIKNYCEKVGARLLLVGLLLDNYGLLAFLRSQKNYIPISYQPVYENSNLKLSFEDIGSDNQHPGPKQHIIYKNAILNFLNSHQA